MFPVMPSIVEMSGGSAGSGRLTIGVLVNIWFAVFPFVFVPVALATGFRVTAFFAEATLVAGFFVAVFFATGFFVVFAMIYSLIFGF